MKLCSVVLLCLVASTYTAPVVEDKNQAKNVVEASSEQPKVSEASPAVISSTSAPAKEQSSTTNAESGESENASTEAAAKDEEPTEAATTETPTTEQPQEDDSAAASTEAAEEGSGESKEASADEAAALEVRLAPLPEPTPAVVAKCDLSAISNEISQESKVEEVKVPAENVESQSRSRTGRRGSVKYRDTQLMHYENDVNFDGNYKYSYADDAGSTVNEEGTLKQIDDETMANSVKGGYSYKDDDGNEYSVSYTADENGFQPVGAHIPTVPPAIARALAYLATAKPWVDPSVHPKNSKKGRKLNVEASADDVKVEVKLNPEEAETKKVEVTDSAPAAASEKPAASSEAPASSEKPATSSEAPSVPAEAAAAETKKVEVSEPAPASSSEKPAASSEAPASSEKPATSSEAPSAPAAAAAETKKVEVSEPAPASSSKAPASSEKTASAESTANPPK